MYPVGINLGTELSIKMIVGDENLALICCINNYEICTSVITLCFVSSMTGDIHGYGSYIPLHFNFTCTCSKEECLMYLA